MDIKIVRNTAQILTRTKSGDYSGDTVKFTVKADKTLTSSRLIDKNVSVSYVDGISKFIVNLLPSDSASLINDTYYYDIRIENDSTDRELLFEGIVYNDKSVRNDTDGATITDTTNVTTVTGSDFDANDTLVSDGTDIIGKSVSEMKTLLGVPSFHVTKWIQSSTNDPICYNIIKNGLSADPYSLVEVVTGIYSSAKFTRGDVGTYNLSFDSSAGLPSASIMDIDIVSKANPTNKIKMAISGANLVITNYNSSGDLVDGFTINIVIRKW